MIRDAKLLECAIETEFDEIESIVNECKSWYEKNRDIIVIKEIKRKPLEELSDDEKIGDCSLFNFYS